jgi:hypothetical protein
MNIAFFSKLSSQDSSILPISFPTKSKEIDTLVDRLDAKIVKYAALIKKKRLNMWG